MPYTQLPPQYVLPAASTSTLGGIKTDGTITTLDANNVLSIDPAALLAGEGLRSANIRGTASGIESIAIGESSIAYDDYSVAIGSHARAKSYTDNSVDMSGIAIGDTAKALNGGIQIGSGTNNDYDAFCVGGVSSNYKLLDLSTGLIPSARLPVADSTTTGAVKADGTTITNSSGTLSAVAATNSAAGIVQPDNVSLEIGGTTNKLQCKGPYVTAQSVSGYEGYRYWSDGTKEAWGLDETNSTTVTVDISAHNFTDPPHVMISPRHTGNAANAPAVTGVTATEFTMNTYQAGIKIMWKVIGK